MSTTSLEYIAASADEAIAKGLNELGLSKDQVDVEIIDAGSKGLFGLGGRQARVRLSVKEDGIRASLQQEEKKAEEVAETKAETDESSEVVSDSTLTIACNVVRDLIEKMHIKAEVKGRIGEAADEIDSKIIMIDIQGDDLSYLIGRHSETLNALQYITGLIVGREVGHWVPLSIDVQGYRERRERQLRSMASRMADQVTKTGRRIALEPMPATERRIIHLALRDSQYVITESIGEEPNRKVVILPKEQ